MRRGGRFLAMAAFFGTSSLFGASYRFRATTHAEGTASAAISMADTEVVGLVDGDKARVEIAKCRNPLLPEGDVLLTPDGGKTFRLLDPSRKTWRAWTPPERAAGNAAAQSMVQVRFLTPVVQKLAEGAGPEIAGYPTKYFKYRVSYVAEVDVMGSSKKTEMERTEELWTAPALSAAGFSAWLKKESAATGDAEFDRKIAAELSVVPGVPLKRVTTTSWKDEGGKAQTVRTTVLVTDLEKSSAPGSLFRVPPEFRDLSREKR